MQSKAFQIRLLGCKGMVSVDHTLPGRVMCVRPSMIKFHGKRELEYEVEEIEGIEKRRGKWMCRVKWKGYPEDENTWEPLSNME